MRAIVGVAVLLAASLNAQTEVTVEGVVTNPLTRTGIAGVKVILIGPPASEPGIHEATTGESGDYHLSGLPPGDYNAIFSKPGYFLPDAAPSGDFGMPRSTPLKIGMEPIRLNREMMPLGALRGRVIAPDGRPAARVTVEAVALKDPVTATTDEVGYFVFDKLKPGLYKLVAKPPAAPPKSVPGAVRVEPVPTYYPSVTDIAEAQPVEVQGAPEQSGIEIHLQSVEVYRVRGAVVNDARQPVKDAEVRLTNAAHGSVFGGSLILPPFRFLMLGGGTIWDDDASVTTSADGKFEFPAVRSGDWRLLVESTFTDPVSESETTLSGHAAVLVARHDSDEIQIPVSGPPPGAAIIEWGSLAPLQETLAYLRLIGVDSPASAVAVNRPGKPVRFLGLNAGRYRIAPLPTLKDGYNVASIWLGEREVTGQEVELNAASPPIRVVMNGKTGRLSGNVDSGRQATVLVTPTNAREADFLLAVDSAADGSFQIPGLPSGNYSLVAYDRIGARVGSEVPLASIMAPAAQALVDEGATATVQLRVYTWPQ